MTRVLVVLVAVLVSSSAVAKEAFDAARFVAPPRWQKSQSPGVIRLTAPAARGSAGELFLFASEPSRGTPEQNFQAAWQKLIATPLGGLAPAQTSTETTSEGWIAVSGVAQYVRQGATWRAVLITATGAGRSMSFLVQVLGQAHDAEVDTFFKELDLVPAAGAPVAAAVPAASGPSAMASGVSAEAGGMTYTPPRGWNRTTRADAVVYVSPPYPNTREVCELLILPMRKGSGDLMRDAVGTFQALFKVDPLGGYPGITPEISRGTSPLGFPYVVLQKTLGHGGSEGPGIILLVAGVGDQIATVFTTSKYFLVSQCFGEAFPSEWPAFFASLRFKGVKPLAESDLKSKLVGSWTATGGHALLRYTLAANGRYAGGSAIGSVARVSPTEVVYTTTGFRGDGAWAVKPDRFSLTPDHSPADGGPFRLEEESKDGRTWKERLCVLGNTGEICYHRDT
ncbi:MAG TPA: hypothetical protein VMH40_02095 [Myxococcaceae bacterium]|nr:hypothetical protein [Myxococcaceae bacterium]